MLHSFEHESKQYWHPWDQEDDQEEPHILQYVWSCDANILQLLQHFLLLSILLIWITIEHLVEHCRCVNQLELSYTEEQF